MSGPQRRARRPGSPEPERSRPDEPRARAPDAAAPEAEVEAPDALERVRRRDELLQVLFWLEGEGFAGEMEERGVARFLGWPAERIAAGLEDLASAGFVERPRVDGPVRLTAAGRREGGRRFVEEFAPILSRPTHYGGECHDPDCGCHDDPLGAAACTAGRTAEEPEGTP